MDQTGKYLFDATSPDLRRSIENLTESDVESCCEYRVFRRGEDYYHEGAVEQIDYIQNNNTINACVAGSEDYSVSIFLEEGQVYGTCTCPYYDVCKHIVATLLYLKKEGTSCLDIVDMPVITESQSLGFLQKHLKSLSKSDLVNLVMKFAPENYVTRIRNQSSPADNAIKVFSKVDKKIKDFFDDDELLWDPSGFEGALMGQLDKLRGLEDKLVNETGNLLIFIIEGIEESFNEGYLYIDSYPGDDYFESEDFCGFVKDFVRFLPLNQRIGYLKNLDEALNHMSYDTFSSIESSYNSYFSDNEYPEVKEYILKPKGMVPVSFLSRMFKYLETGLSDHEKENILVRLSDNNNDYVVILSRLLIKQERYSDAYKTISQRIDNQDGIISFEMMELYLELSKKLSCDLRDPARKAIEGQPNAMMLHRIKDLPVTPLTVYEDILREKRPDELLSFYEKEKRLEDALSLINEGSISWDSTLFEFFRKNKKSVPEDAGKYFVKRIEKNLADTGNKYYERIAESISQLKQLNPDLAGKWLETIRAQYKRRSNLISMLNRY